MNKTPISILQEYMVKNNKPIPVYNNVGHQYIGTNDHEFTIRVTSGDISADGKGSTKQEAKQNAAKEMLLLIGGGIPARVSANNNMPIESSVRSSPKQIDDDSLQDKGTNYIGLLHEYCAQTRITAPTFVEANSWGPSHMMSFTIRCKVADIEEEATAKTKKQARTDAAIKVWSKVSKQKFDISINKTFEERVRKIGFEIQDLKLGEIFPDYKEENKVAEKNYLKLTKLKSTTISDKVTLENCHRVFTTNSYSISLRRSIIVLLGQINTEKEDISLLPSCKSVLEKTAKLLNVKLDRIQLTHRKPDEVRYDTDLKYTFCFKLHTEPPIISISSAETSALAELKAIFNTAFNLKILLS